MTKRMLPALAALMLAGCVTPPTPDMLAKAEYGPPPPANYQKLIKDDITESLIDPTSPLFKIKEPFTGYKMVTRTIPHYGWFVCGYVNAKNRMGGYTGDKPFYAFFREGNLIGISMGEDTDFSYMNGDINNVCGLHP